MLKSTLRQMATIVKYFNQNSLNLFVVAILYLTLYCIEIILLLPCIYI